MTEFNLKPIVKEQTTQKKVYNQIKRSILNGGIDNETIFTEVKMAETLHTSRTPVRAALQDLANEGLIEPIPRKGYSIRKITPEEQDEIIFLRTLIESEVIKKTARIITSEQIDFLKDTQKKQEDAMKRNDWTKFIDLDQEFHVYLVKIGDYKIIEQILLNLQDLTKLIGLKAIGRQGRMKNVLQEHWHIIEALEQGKSNSAAQYMKDHLKYTNETLYNIDHPTEH